MGKLFKGDTKDAGAPILGAKFWKKGVTIKGRVMRKFATANGPCWQLELDEEITVSGAQVSPEQKGKITGAHFSVGNMKGFIMALVASGIPCDEAGSPELLPGDEITLECTGEQESGKASPMVTFKVEVNRPEAAAF